jgi:hypothetical protein
VAKRQVGHETTIQMPKPDPQLLLARPRGKRECLLEAGAFVLWLVGLLGLMFALVLL